jgi:hypothetical protein
MKRVTKDHNAARAKNNERVMMLCLCKKEVELMKNVTTLRVRKKKQ